MKLGRSSRTLFATALAAGLSALLLALAGCAPATETAKEEKFEAPALPGYEAMVIPADNPMTGAKVELGKQLFYDKRLSGDNSRACYSCHMKENGLTDGKPTAIGAYEAKLPRSSPTLWNIGYHSKFYWDGRSDSLEKQAVAAWRAATWGPKARTGTPAPRSFAPS